MVSSYTWTRLVAVTALWVASINAQTDHFGGDEVATVWTAFTNPVGPGNGAFLSPRDEVLVVVSSDSVVRGFDPETGTPLWTFPPTAGSFSTGGVFFSPFVAVPYLVYCVSNGASSSVIGINQATGDQLFSTGTIQGQCAGTPVTTADGQYVLVTHNVGGALGFFSIYDTAIPADAVFTYSFAVEQAPFGAIGHYWDPIQGYFDGGLSNSNDVFIWCLDSNEATNGTVGQVFAFQMPVVVGSGYNVTTVGGERNFVSPLPPVITNGGLSMYWANFRSEQRAWVGEENLGRRDFGTNGVATVGFERGEPAGRAAFAPPTLSDDSAMPFVIGPTASNQLFRMSFDYSEGDAATITLTAVPVTSRVVISRDGARAYYGTPAPDGNIISIDSTSLQQFWNISIVNGISGEIALNLNGDTLYVVDALGGVTALTVADAPEFTFVPTISPVNQTRAPVFGTFSPAPGGPNSTQLPSSTVVMTPPPVSTTVSPAPSITANPAGAATAVPTPTISTILTDEPTPAPSVEGSIPTPETGPPTSATSLPTILTSFPTPQDGTPKPSRLFETASPAPDSEDEEKLSDGKKGTGKNDKDGKKGMGGDKDGMMGKNGKKGDKEDKGRKGGKDDKGKKG